jgi:hypothetical protein
MIMQKLHGIKVIVISFFMQLLQFSTIYAQNFSLDQGTTFSDTAHSWGILIDHALYLIKGLAPFVFILFFIFVLLGRYLKIKFSQYILYAFFLFLIYQFNSAIKIMQMYLDIFSIPTSYNLFLPIIYIFIAVLAYFGRYLGIKLRYKIYGGKK